MFEIYIDSNQDGVDDYMIFNTDQFGYNSDNVTSDAFITALKDLHTGRITPQAPLNAVAATVPTTCSLDVGLQVPMPTLPFIMINPPTGVDVPIPILEPTVGR